MQPTYLPNGHIRLQDTTGATTEIAPGHPDYQRLAKQCRPAKPTSPMRSRLYGIFCIFSGMAAWWLNWHTLLTKGEFYIKFTIFAPLGVFGGLLLVLRPEWSGPWTADSPREQVIATIAVIVLTAIVSLGTFYFLSNYHP